MSEHAPLKMSDFAPPSYPAMPKDGLKRRCNLDEESCRQECSLDGAAHRMLCQDVSELTAFHDTRDRLFYRCFARLLAPTPGNLRGLSDKYCQRNQMGRVRARPFKMTSTVFKCVVRSAYVPIRDACWRYMAHHFFQGCHDAPSEVRSRLLTCFDTSS